MKKEDLERAVLDLWLTTQIPLTQAHIQYHTGVSRKRLAAWLDELVLEGVLGVDVSDDGDMLYTVTGAERPEHGPTSFSEKKKLDTLGPTRNRSKKRGNDDALADLQSEVLAGQARGLVKRAGKSLTKTKEGEKSLLVSGGLSLLGPLGWFYAGSLKEAGLGSLAFVLLWSILPSFLLMPLLFLGLPLSGVAGLLYAWQYNRHGHRRPLLGSGEDDED